MSPEVKPAEPVLEEPPEALPAPPKLSEGIEAVEVPKAMPCVGKPVKPNPDALAYFVLLEILSGILGAW